MVQEEEALKGKVERAKRTVEDRDATYREALAVFRAADDERQSLVDSHRAAETRIHALQDILDNEALQKHVSKRKR